MNYQEIVNSQQSLVTHREMLPFGSFYRKQKDGKYRLIIDLKQELSDSIVFCEALKKDQEWSEGHRSRQQVQFCLESDEQGLRAVELEQGNFQTLAQLLFDEPATIAANGFIERVVNDLFDITDKLHSDGLYQLCYAPRNIFVRKGDTAPLLLFHGSFYTGVNDVKSLYAGVEDFIAPEVMSREGADERSDVYGMGKLLEYLFDQSSMPLEYRRVVKKATAADPAARYKSIAQMRAAISARRGMKRSVIALVAAVVIALLGVWAYFDLMPQTEYIEFVEPVPKEVVEDPFDQGDFDPELGFVMGDDSIAMTEEDLRYMAKLEEIFRKRFESVAEKALSKVYDSQRMNSSEKNFMAGSNKMMEELMEQQNAMAGDMGISEDRASAIAQEVINRITAEKQRNLPTKGYIKENEE
jgi:hypothetical protein